MKTLLSKSSSLPCQDVHKMYQLFILYGPMKLSAKSINKITETIIPFIPFKRYLFVFIKQKR